MLMEDHECLRRLLDVNDFDPVKEILAMTKPIYGLKDAPRAWRKKLHQVVIQWLSRRQFYFAPKALAHILKADSETWSKANAILTTRAI